MISPSDFYYEIIVDIVTGCLFALLFFIIYLLNYYAKVSLDSEYYLDHGNHEEQDKTENEMTQTSTTISSSS
jgi:hypothetical protein